MKSIMQTTAINQIAAYFGDTHQTILQLVDEMPDEELAWRPHPTANSIAFYLWHLARWADYIPACLPDSTPELAKRLGPRRQIGHQEHLAAQWQLDPAALGEEESGWELDPTLAAQMKLPGKEALLDYTRRAFAALEQILPAVDDEQFQAQRGQEWATDTVGHFILQHLCHENEHLGMMRYLHGLYQISVTVP